MKVYGVFVMYKDGSCNINEAFNTHSKAKAAILYKIKAGDLYKKDKYHYFDLKQDIIYEIKEIDLWEE